MTIAAHISRSVESRKAAIAAFLAGTAARQVIYVCPKSIAWQAEMLPANVSRFSFEDLDRRDTWLTINAMIGPSTALVMECVSRYARITSPKFTNLQRLSKQIDDKLLIDHVPLCEGIEYIYTPYSYLDRSILGFSHWYAFREAYDEVDESGRIVSSHDPAVIAGKIGKITTSSDPGALLRDRRTVPAPTTAAEKAAYAAKKTELFAAHKNPGKIVTRLADHAHAAGSRRAAIVEHAASRTRQVLVLTNLASYADKLRKLSNATHVVFDSFKPASRRRDLAAFDHVVYAECPIVKSYLALDIEAQLPASATAWVVEGDSNVDTYLNRRWRKETDAIAAVMAALEARNGA